MIKKTIINVRDQMGRLMAVLVNQFQVAGSYNIPLDGEGLKNDIHFIRIIAGDKYRMNRLVRL